MKKTLSLILMSMLLFSCGKTEPVMVSETVVVQGEKVEAPTATATTEVKTEVKVEAPVVETKPAEAPAVTPVAVVPEPVTVPDVKVETPATPVVATEIKVEAPVVIKTPEAALTKGQQYFNNTVNSRVFDAPTGGKRTDYLRKGTRVTILEETVVGEKKPVTYTKVQYKKDRKTSTGWVEQKSLVPSLDEVVPARFGKLNFAPFEKKEHPNNPKIAVKGIYVSATSFASTKTLDRLIELTKKTPINAFVIDVKNDDGHILWKMNHVTSKYGLDSDKREPIRNIEAAMKKLKDNNIYAIARIVSFKDPTYAKAKPDRAIMDTRTGKPFTNADGLIWVSAHDRELWQYNIDIAMEAAKVGFNEIQFDYVRFPASNGGKLDPVLNYRNPKKESKPAAIQNFLMAAHKQISPLGAYTAADVYGQVGTEPGDMDLGQHWEAVSNVVDYICPMVYPSHYANGMYGTVIPDAEPYKTVYGSTRDSLNRNYNIDTPAVVRTWIQDFTAPWVKGHIKYGVKEVNEQIKALKDLGINDYILWNAANRYSFQKQLDAAN